MNQSGLQAESDFLPSSPVAILVGAGVSTQVEDEKALGELICAIERMSEGLVLALPSLHPRGGGGEKQDHKELGAKRREDTTWDPLREPGHGVPT